MRTRLISNLKKFTGGATLVPFQFVKNYVRNYSVVIGSCFLYGLAVNAFFVPHGMLASGISGIAMLFFYFFATPIGIVAMVLNIPLFILAYRLMPREYLINAFFGMMVMSLAIDLTSFARDWNLVQAPILAAIYGGVIGGAASGFIFKVNGSTGGMDILAAIMRRYYGIGMGLFTFLINILIMTSAALLFDIENAMYTLISIFIAAQVTDKVLAGFNSKKVVVVISEKPEEIAQAIFATLTRGVTFLNGAGAYTNQPKKLLYIVVTLTQTPKITEIVQTIDPTAFMIIQDASEVLGQGKGFSPLYNK